MHDVDQFSMALMVAVNLMTIAFALPWFMGQSQKMSRPALNAQQFLLLQGLSWLLIFGAGQVDTFGWNALLSTSATAASLGALWQLHKALKGWLGQRCKALTMALPVLCMLTLAGVMALIQSKPYQVAWFDIGYGLSLIALISMALYPRTKVARAWRYLFFGAGLCIALNLIARGYSALHASWLHSFATEPSTHITLYWLMPVFSGLCFVSILMACRDEELRLQQTDAPEDPLTGLPLRQAIKGQARFMLHRSLRENLPLAVILIDMDHFSRVNKRHGYQTGDEALQLMSRALKKQMRGDEVVARWQGESFCLMVHADLIGARALLTRIKSAIQMGAQYELQVDLDFSAGCALAPSAWSGLKLDELTKQADIALQQAKKMGRGRTEFITLTPPSQDGAESTLSSGT